MTLDVQVIEPAFVQAHKLPLLRPDTVERLSPDARRREQFEEENEQLPITRVDLDLGKSNLPRNRMETVCSLEFLQKSDCPDIAIFKERSGGLLERCLQPAAQPAAICTSPALTRFAINILFLICNLVALQCAQNLRYLRLKLICRFKFSNFNLVSAAGGFSCFKKMRPKESQNTTFG